MCIKEFNAKILYFYLQINSILNLANFRPMHILNNGKQFLLFFIQFNVPFKIISLIETSQSIGGAKQENPGKTT